MKKIAFLTTKDLGNYILDEDCLENALKAYDKIYAKYVPWSEDINWSDFDMVVIRTTWDYTENLKKFLKVLENIKNSGAKLFNPYSLICWNSDKIYLRALSEKGVSVVESLYFSEENFLEQAENFKSEKFILKPRVGAGSKGISFVSLDELTRLKKNHQKTKTHFVQPFIKEIHQGERSYFYFNGEFSYAIKKTPKKGDFRVQEEYGGIITIHEANAQELEEAKKAVESVKEHDPLYLRVDAVITEKNEWKLMELEAIEPSMFFRVVSEGAELFASALMERL